MAKKRKEPSSETQQPEQPPQEQIIEQPPIEQQGQQPQIEGQEEQTNVEQEQEQHQNMDEHQTENEEQEQEQHQNMDEHQTENEEEEDPEEDHEEETVNASNNAVSTTPEENGGERSGDGEEEEDVEEEDVEEDLEEKPVEMLLEPFSKEQLVLLLKEAISKYPDLVESVQKLADVDPAHRKIFVHGLSWDTNTETLTREFGKYGEIEDCKAVVDKVSGKSKGYGFILFKHRSGAQKALKEPQKKIGNRITSCQLASTGPVPIPLPAASPVSEYTQRKIFVSNVSTEIDPQKLLEFFSKYGEIEDGPLGLDKQTGKPKGFALFVYKTMDSVRKALEEPHKNFEGHTLHCQKAIDGPKPNKPYFQHHHHQQQLPHQQQYHHHTSKKTKYSSGGGAGPGHLMAPSGPAVGFNPAVTPPALTPALGQALTALLASQGAGLGITNLLGGLAAQVNPQGMPPVMNNTGYGNQGGGGYGGQPAMQGGYQNPQIGQGGSRPQQGGAYMGHHY